MTTTRKPKVVGLVEAKRQVADLIAAGYKVADAMHAVNRAVKTYENWRADDLSFRAKVDGIRDARSSARKRGLGEDVTNIDFATWRKQFLNQETYPHQQAWIDVIENRGYEARDGELFELADPNRCIINVPPFHAKSQTLTVEYVTYRICMNPNIRVIIVSKRQDQANKFLTAIKRRLTSNQWASLQATFAPDGGFKPLRGEGKWGANSFYVAGTDSGEKDPTVEALGLGAQIYGSRADLIILDDCVVLANAHEFEKQIEWLESEVENRVRDGKIIIIGTRLAPRDLYTELRNGERYLSGKSPWSYLRQPMVLRYSEKPEDWVTLWPFSTSPLETGQAREANGLYSAWPGPKASQVRSRKPARVWSLVYQQQDVADDAVFSPIAVMGSCDRRRKAGPLRAGGWGHPRNGMEGQYIIASMDPAMSGDTFTLVGAVDKPTKRRRLMNAWVQGSPSPQYIRDLIKSVTVEYGVHEWVIEQNAFQLFLIYDEEIRSFCRGRGVKITPHYTSRNKQDPDFGVASIAPLFGDVKRIQDGTGRQTHEGNNLIDLPDPDSSEGVRTLIEELITWVPGKKGKDLKQDGPMALWFFELRCREALGLHRAGTKNTHFLENRYLTRGDMAKRIVIPAASLALMGNE